MATYYISPSGNDTTGVGSNGNPWKTFQKLINTLVAGDTGIAKNGIYTDYLVRGSIAAVGHIWAAGSGVTSSSGTLANPITLKAENTWGAKIQVPAYAGTRRAFFFQSRNYWNIEGFEIQGGYIQHANQEAGMYLTSCTGMNVRYNWVHDIGYVCSSDQNGMPGIELTTCTDSVCEWNRVHAVGRKNGNPAVQEGGCALSPETDGGDPAHDHGFYISGGTNVTLRHNLIYDCIAGYGIHLYRSSGVFTGIKVYNNTIARKTQTGSRPPAQMIICASQTDLEVKNNLLYDPITGAFSHLSLSCTNCVVSFNQCSKLTQGKTGFPTSGLTFSNNVQNTAPGFVNEPGNNFRLAVGSAAIESGTNVGRPFNGSAPSKGCFASPKFTSASITTGSESTVKIVFSCNVAPPLLPATGITGFTCRVDGVGRTITAAVVNSNTQVWLTLATPVAEGQAVDISYSGGNLTDSSFNGQMGQPFSYAMTNQSVTNTIVNPSQAPAAPTGLAVVRL